MKNKSAITFLQVFHVRKLEEKQTSFTGVGHIDLTKQSEFVCNEISFDRAVAVAEAEAEVSQGRMCVIIPMTVVHSL